MRYFLQQPMFICQKMMLPATHICIPKLALEIQDLLLPATVLSPRLDDNYFIEFRVCFHPYDDMTLGFKSLGLVVVLF
jgi:hypothetical protein